MPPNEVVKIGTSPSPSPVCPPSPSPFQLPVSPLYSPLRAATSALSQQRPSSWAPNGNCKWVNQAFGRWSEPRANASGTTRLDHPIRQMDAELKRLREAPVQMESSPGKFQLRVDISNIFAPEDIELHLSQGHLTICAETQIQLDQWTSVVRRFRRNLTLPEDIRTEAIATQMDSRGFLTVTVLRRSRG